MPTLKRFDEAVILMFPRDHLPPHFHVRLHDGREVLVDLASLQVLRGAIPGRQLRQALQWALQHQAELKREWKRLSA